MDIHLIELEITISIDKSVNFFLLLKVGAISYLRTQLEGSQAWEKTFPEES